MNLSETLVFAALIGLASCFLYYGFLFEDPQPSNKAARLLTSAILGFATMGATFATLLLVHPAVESGWLESIAAITVAAGVHIAGHAFVVKLES